MPVRDLSVFFPAFDEEANIERTVERALDVLRGLPLEKFEVLVVDDGSTDDTAKIADALADHERDVRVVHHPQNRGYGAALRTGFESARCEWVFFTDGDGQFDMGELPLLLDQADRFDIVVGYRKRRADHLGRRINTFLWSTLVRTMLRVPVRDVDCAFKLLRQDALQRIGPLTSDGAVISTELLAKARRADISITEVPVSHYPRLAGTPTGANPRVIVKALRELVQLRATIAHDERERREGAR
jgi:glycosyltransferase involved in cell wall biosynthesis